MIRRPAYVSRAAAQGLAPAQTTLAEMDKLIPLDQRKKGVALAQTLAKPAKTEPEKPEKPAKAPAKTAAIVTINPPTRTAGKPPEKEAAPAPAKTSGR